MKLNSFLIPALLAVQIFCQSASAAETQRRLNISTLPKEIQEDLGKRFPQIGTGKVTLEVVDEIIRYLQLRPEFDLVQVVDAGSGQLKLNTARSTRIGSIKFEGLKAISESEAKQAFAVNANDILNQDQLVLGGEKLTQLYNQAGYRNASLDIELPPDSSGNVQVTIKIKEGVQTLIGSIQFTSSNTDLNKTLESRLSREKGYALTDAQLADVQKTIREYLNSRFHIRAEIFGPEISFNSNESRATLKFRLEKTESYMIDYLGNRQVSSSTLNRSLDIGNFYSANPNIGSELTSKIKNLYLSRGYARVEVQSEETEGRKPFTRKITFNIDEGPKIKISKFEFTGSVSRSQSYYSKLLKKNASDLIQDDYYNKLELDQSFESFRVELQNQGYLLARINSTRTQYNKEKNQVVVYINLDEGPLTKITNIQFIGNTTIPAPELLEVLELEKDQALQLGELEKAIQNLKTHYQEKGYIEMALLNEKEDLVTYNENNTLATLNFKIKEGPQVRISSIVLDGNAFTRDYVLLKEIELQPGDTVTPSKVDEAVAKLQRTGYFNTVEIRTLEEKSDTANRTLVIKVSERDPGLFTLGAGATNDLGLTLRGYTGIAYNNIMGTGRGVSLRLEGNYNVNQIKYLESKVTLGYVEPYLFDSKIRGRLNLTRSSQLTDYNIKKVSDVNQTITSIERDLTSHVTIIYELLNWAHVFDFGLDPTKTIDSTPQDIVTTGPRLDIDYRDNPFNPTRGNFTTVALEYSSPEIGSSKSPNEIKFTRATGSFTHYLRVPYFKGDYMVWANSVRGGYLTNLSETGGVPYDKKGFYLGGSSTIRSFNGTKDFFPTYNQLRIDETDVYYMTTFASMYLIKSEFRFPIFGSFGGTVFYDGGSVHIDKLDMGDEYRDAAGFGFHYNTPVGPVNLEIAWKLDHKPGESPYEVHLSIGSF
ncbi:POTRA domain-containing protein [Bdellovibrio sp. HCB337]|uniref:POTRA domain-containing protein n=1 Tax=Bdellovibrio sp. HCB337 TaxID=3394358 RepID=UPI0039A533FA